MKRLLSCACCLSLSFAAFASVTNYSNTVTVEAWARDDVHFDTETGMFSSTNIPTAAEAAAISNAADRIDEFEKL